MHTKLFTLLMIIFFVIGIITITILYYGFDPLDHPQISIAIMSIAIIAAGGSGLGLIFLGIKKVIRRGHIYPIDAFRAFRHGVLCVLSVLGFFLLYIYNGFHILASFLFICIVFFLELLLTKMEDS